ncbi:lipopolysaccharide export system protein LptC [Novosphingobium sp. SG751A]|uniref:LPS export ABC transporter periplasmic protein LptC n=1 Tax=Novosphingobium sp. SG751A TaxID=2587000 RepID=UPI0015559D3F|nr:LPS export ABC transporter periplasmic protein LptC [Novosphingobium sp. SG751A]NOW45621.1 lipopolysaccharide export system protein LptC [Novosphingobium sp. SG751A]
MTIGADLLRNRRRAKAAPGGAQDRMIRFLFTALPVGLGMVTAVMVVSPIFPHGEVSFLLDRNKVAVAKERLAVTSATYRGADDKGRPFALNAGQAVQHSAQVPIVEMRGLNATLAMESGPARVEAPSARYDINREVMQVAGPVRFSEGDGYRMQTSDVAINLKTRQATASGGVTGIVPAGTFAADHMAADISARTVVLQGRARLRMTPSKMKAPR